MNVLPMNRWQQLVALAKTMGWQVTQDHTDGVGGESISIDGKRYIVVNDMLSETERIRCVYRELSRDDVATREPFSSQLQRLESNASPTMHVGLRRAA